MPDEIVLSRMMTALDLEFEKAMHYNEGYERNNDYGLPGQVMRPVHISSVPTFGASFNPADYKEAQQHLSLHAQMTQELLALLWRGPQTLNIFETPHQKQTLMMSIFQQLTWMTWYVLRSLCQIARNTCVSTQYLDQHPHPHNPIRWRCQQSPYNPSKWKYL